MKLSRPNSAGERHHPGIGRRPPILLPRAEHIIEMRNQDDAGNHMAFQPGFVKVEVGDTVKFVPADKGHNAQSVPNIWPAGVPEGEGATSAEKLSLRPRRMGSTSSSACRTTAWAWWRSCRSASPSISTR